MSNRQEYFRALNLQRAKQRKHRPCPTHGRSRRVCDVCTKMFCPRCAPHPCLTSPEKKPILTQAWSPPKPWRKLWSIVKPLGAFRIDPHPDADALKVLFPPNALSVSTAGELADKIWLLDTMKAIAESTPFRAGRGTKPPHWWVSVRLKP